jgi:hypothetical protein
LVAEGIGGIAEHPVNTNKRSGATNIFFKRFSLSMDLIAETGFLDDRISAEFL